jgi:hypothetical protein
MQFIIKTNDIVLTAQNNLCKVQSIRSKIALLRGVGSDKKLIACVKDLRTLKSFHGATTII